MVMQLFNNKELLYTIIGLLVVLLSALLYLILARNKKKMVKKQTVRAVKIENNDIDEAEGSKAEIEIMIEQMQRDLEDKNVVAVKSFEDEQEEKSIISYQELLKINKKDLPNVDDEEQYEQEEKEEKDVEKTTQKFKTTEFISPIYGRLDSKADYPTIRNFKEKKDEEKPVIPNNIKFERTPTVIKNNELEKTLNIKPLSAEIKKNDEFLKTLKDFRKKLE